MMTPTVILRWALDYSSLLLLAVIFVTFSCLSREFWELANLVNIVIQTCPTAIAATGMTLVLLIAGVDLSVGSIMFLAVAIAGKLVFVGQPIWLAAIVAIAVGIIGGGINGLLITRWRVIAFVATLAMLYIARGLGLWLTNTRAMNMPEQVTHLGTTDWCGMPLPIIITMVVILVVHGFLTRTPWGRQLYAIGSDSQAARKAGVRVDLLSALVYVACGFCASLAGLIALTQTGAVSPSFGQNKEFAAIAAAVLGGTSLFGGRGNVLPGTFLGAVLFQTVENGLVMVNADPYLYPLILSCIIFIAVLLDTLRIESK